MEIFYTYGLIYYLCFLFVFFNDLPLLTPLSLITGDHHLALLLSQSCMGDSVPRQIMAKQLSNWAECGADTTLSPARLLLYVLIAGQATHICRETTINVFRGLDWRRALGLHLWYLCPSTCSVSEGLLAYERGAGIAKTDSEQYCQKPLPRYLLSHTRPDSTANVGFDMSYHLIKLFVDPTYRLDQLLNPLTNTPDPLDVTTSWLVLSLIQSLGYTHVERRVANGLHLSMASYLESAGMWYWAIFVLLFLEEEVARVTEIKRVLCRYVQVIDGVELEDDSFEKHRMQIPERMEEEDGGFVEGEMDSSIEMEQEREAVSSPQLNDEPIETYQQLLTYEEQENFLIKKLKIPETWINESKAVLARSLNMVEAEAWYLIKAGDLNRAHNLLLETIAPNAIINDDHEYLRRFIVAFEASSTSLSVNIPSWSSGGAVYSNYLHVLSAVEEIKQSQQPTQSKVEALRPRLLNLCTQLDSLATPSARYRLCVSEISRVVIGVLRAVLGEDLSAITAIATQVSQLPLTNDCALQELNTLTHQYLVGIGR